MKKYFCDKCGEKITPEELRDMGLAWYSILHSHREYHLCKKHVEELQNWLKGR